MSLAVKYRPTKLDEVIGQDIAVKIIQSQINKTPEDRHHVLLLFGQNGTGKTTIAKLYAESITSKDAIHEIDAASNNGVDFIRELNEECSYGNLFDHPRVYILDEAHMLSKAAFNAMLKLLEDTGIENYFILCTTEKNKLLETVVTRCLQIPFKWVNKKAIETRLEQILKEEGLERDKASLSIISTYAAGSMRLAISTLESILASYTSLSKENVSEFLGLLPKSDIEEIFTFIVQKDNTGLFKKINKLQESNILNPEILTQLYYFIRNVYLVKIGITDQVPNSILWKYENLTKIVTVDKLQKMLEVLANEPLSATFNTNILIEIALIKLLTC